MIFESQFPGAGMINTERLSMRVTLPDALLDRFEPDAQRLKKPLEAILAQHLERVADLPVDARVLILHGADRERLEELLGPLATPAALVRAVENLAQVSIGGTKVDLERWQHEEIKRRAARNNRPVKAEFEAAVQQIRDLVFSSVHA